MAKRKPSESANLLIPLPPTHSGAAEGREGLPSLRLWKRGTQTVFGEAKPAQKLSL